MALLHRPGAVNVHWNGTRIGTASGPVLLTPDTVPVSEPAGRAADGVHTSVPGAASVTVPGTYPAGPRTTVLPEKSAPAGWMSGISRRVPRQVARCSSIWVSFLVL